ncbi:MAG: hypothetical protein AB1646_22810 [Thermodesulfobacteriota bacterium]
MWETQVPDEYSKAFAETMNELADFLKGGFEFFARTWGGGFAIVPADPKSGDKLSLLQNV